MWAWLAQYGGDALSVGDLTLKTSDHSHFHSVYIFKDDMRKYIFLNRNHNSKEMLYKKRKRRKKYFLNCFLSLERPFSLFLSLFLFKLDYSSRY